MKNIIKELDSSFAIIEKDGKVIISSGKIHELNTLKELEHLQREIKNKVVFISPFCLVKEEKGYDVIGEEKIIAMEVENEISTTREELLSILPNNDLCFSSIQTDISDDNFGKLVQKAKEEIFEGNINQLILSRKFTTDINISIETILSIYSKLLNNRGQYMTFLFNTPDEIFIGASPEKHLQIENNNVVMNPIAGTIGKGEEATFYKRFIGFLSDDKEISELAMIIDEELKMISKISKGGIIKVPLLKEVGAVIHTEAYLNGKIKDNISIIDALRYTMYAPTLVGGPIESAFSNIKEFENDSRGYYGGAFGIIGKDFLDSAIVIRTAFINKLNSILTVRAGAGIVKDSIPEKESNETILKSNGFFGALKGTNANNSKSFLNGLSEDEIDNVDKLLENRKTKLSNFYINSHLHDNLEVEEIKGKRFILINNGDDFVYLSGYMIEKMGGEVSVVNNKDFNISVVDDFDIVLLGPGYGNINDKLDKKMLNLLDISDKLIKANKKILGICLGHQAICKVKGYEVQKQEEITQGEQLEVEINGNKEILGFYNSFSPVAKGTKNNIEKFARNRILNYRDENISSTQSHPESIMSINGFSILKNMILDLI